MATIIAFYTSLLLICALFAKKHFGISISRHEKILELVSKNEKNLYKAAEKSKELVSKIHFRNLHRISLTTANFIKKESILLKKKLDSKQPKFFLKPEKIDGRNQHHHASFFLRKVSEYKNHK